MSDSKGFNIDATDKHSDKDGNYLCGKSNFFVETSCLESSIVESDDRIDGLYCANEQPSREESEKLFHMEVFREENEH